MRGLVSQLVARNLELEKRLSGRGFKNSEGISSKQLLLLIDTLPLNSAQAEANDKLQVASGIDASRSDEERTVPATKPAPRLRQPAPPHLPRVDNEIKVPEAERACPKCGQERACIGHDVSETIELVPQVGDYLAHGDPLFRECQSSRPLDVQHRHLTRDRIGQEAGREQSATRVKAERSGAVTDVEEHTTLAREQCFFANAAIALQ